MHAETEMMLKAIATMNLLLLRPSAVAGLRNRTRVYVLVPKEVLKVV
ncbi:MAG TPA: hypothetical protein VN044_05760 [Verrucomicrobiae bacterium]|jgi:hypothetical protein|nr:hypothetical protein [Verrucomicrobiae bacterium]